MYLPRSGNGPDNPTDTDSVEDWVDAVQRVSLEEMEAKKIDEGSLASAEKSLRANLVDVWDRLDSDTQRMLATAEHFGSKATAAMDHSGPMLGLAAACERLLRNFVQTTEHDISTVRTFGRLLLELQSASLPTAPPSVSKLQTVLRDKSVDLPSLRALIDDLFALNSNFRIPAAHAELVEEEQWIRGRARVLLGESAALVRIVNILHL